MNPGKTDASIDTPEPFQDDTALTPMDRVSLALTLRDKEGLRGALAEAVDPFGEKDGQVLWGLAAGWVDGLLELEKAAVPGMESLSALRFSERLPANLDFLHWGGVHLGWTWTERERGFLWARHRLQEKTIPDHPDVLAAFPPGASDWSALLAHFLLHPIRDMNRNRHGQPPPLQMPEVFAGLFVSLPPAARAEIIESLEMEAEETLWDREHPRLFQANLTLFGHLCDKVRLESTLPPGRVLASPVPRL
jgi:hypothetical protein